MVCFSEAIVGQVLDELGLQMADQLSGNYDNRNSYICSNENINSIVNAKNWILKLLVKLSDLPSANQSLGQKGGAAKQPAAVAAGGGGVSDADADLEARLENLRRQ